MRVFSQINKCQQKNKQTNKQTKQKQKEKRKKGARLLGLAKSIYYYSKSNGSMPHLNVPTLLYSIRGSTRLERLAPYVR